MVPNIQYAVPTWNQIYCMLLNLAQKIRCDSYSPDIIVGIARGGIVPTRILSDLLDISELALIQINFYVDIAKTKQEPVLKQSLPKNIAGTKALLVDDISDTGRSLKLAKVHLQQQDLKEIKIATLYANEATITMPDYFETLTSRWVVFPWDVKETIRKILQSHDIRGVNAEMAKLVESGLLKQLAQRLIIDIQKEK
jgi:uncharacterized protein